MLQQIHLSRLHLHTFRTYKSKTSLSMLHHSVVCPPQITYSVFALLCELMVVVEVVIFMIGYCLKYHM